jgi:MoxR-like ATPase
MEPMMTEDKDFKRLVRDEARRTGRRYTEVREELRPAEPGVPGGPAAPVEPAVAAERYERLVATIGTHVFGHEATVRLVALALVTPGNVLVTARAGNGMTALGQGVATAVGGHLVSIDGRTGLDPGETSRWRPDDVVVISHFDGLAPADQVEVVEARRVPAIVLAKLHPIAGRMPHPPDDDTRERFLFGATLGDADAEVERRIVDAFRDGTARPSREAAVDGARGLGELKAAAAAVEVPDEVRRHGVDVLRATRTDPSVLVGASTVTSLDLVQACAAHALVHGRDVATVDDVDELLVPILRHRLVFRPGLDPAPALEALLPRVLSP